jgi:hypothetical protein
MVKALDIEELFKKYCNENHFECADALYLLAQFNREQVSQTLMLRYQTVSPLVTVLEDLKRLGVESMTFAYTEDTRIEVREIIKSFYETICLEQHLQRAEASIKKMTQVSLAILYLAVKLGPSFENLLHYSDKLLPRFCELIFQLKVDDKTLQRAFEELTACYVFQHPKVSYWGVIPSFFDRLAARLEPYLPKVEIKINWPK